MVFLNRQTIFVTGILDKHCLVKKMIGWIQDGIDSNLGPKGLDGGPYRALVHPIDALAGFGWVWIIFFTEGIHGKIKLMAFGWEGDGTLKKNVVCSFCCFAVGAPGGGAESPSRKKS